MAWRLDADAAWAILRYLISIPALRKNEVLLIRKTHGSKLLRGLLGEASPSKQARQWQQVKVAVQPMVLQWPRIRGNAEVDHVL